MAHLQQSSRRSSEASDSLVIGNNASIAPGKQPRTANLGAGGQKPVQLQAKNEGAAPQPAQDQAEGQAQDQAQGDANLITSQDIQYEIIAHKMGYQDTIGGEEAKLLARWGYEDHWVSQINDAATGFFVGLIMPNGTVPGLTPILVFRGTGDFRDIVSDIHPVAVGQNQFAANRQFVQQLIAEAGGKVDVTGHSLGGALAQHCAAAFTSSMNQVITFQAPGIDAAQVAAFNQNEDRPSVRHHIAGGDLVDTAGDGHLAGEVFRHTPGGGPTSHVKFLLTTPEYADLRQELGLTDEVLASIGITKQTNHSPVQRFEEYPHPVKSAIDEFVRRAAGVVLYPVLTGVGILTQSDDATLREQITNGGEAGLVGHPVSERAYMVDRLCRGMTGDADEEAILTVLRASASAGDFVSVVDVVGPYLIAENINGKQYTELRKLFQSHYYTQASQDSAVELIQSCIDGRTSEWEQEMIADILCSRSDGRAIITRIGAIYKNGGFAEGLDEIQWQLDGSDQRRVDAIYAVA